MADIELRHLRTMAAIAEEGTFSRAAGRPGYTQSSVSQQIAALEKPRQESQEPPAPSGPMVNAGSSAVNVP